jgi:hypothetical protein
MSFRFTPPAPEEARAFAVQLVGSVLALGLLALLFWRAPTLRPVLIGAGAGLIYGLARSAWALELKARRSQAGGVDVDEAGVRWHDGRREQERAWAEITVCEVRGGKLRLGGDKWAWEFSAREIEDGVALVEEVAARWKNGGKRGFTPPTLFIPLTPR